MNKKRVFSRRQFLRSSAVLAGAPMLIPGASSTIRPQFEAWLQQHPQEKKSAALWVKLLKLAREAKTLHDLNGKLLNIHLQQTTDAIAVLTQQHQAHSLYGSDGQSAMSTGSRIVDSA